MSRLYEHEFGCDETGAAVVEHCEVGLVWMADQYMALDGRVPLDILVQMDAKGIDITPYE